MLEYGLRGILRIYSSPSPREKKNQQTKQPMQLFKSLKTTENELSHFLLSFTF